MTTDIEQQLRRAFDHRAQQTAVSSDLDRDQNASMQRSATLVRSWLPYAGVAAAAVLVVVGLVALRAVRTDQASPTPTAPVDTAPSVTTVAAAQESPFAGTWVSTGTDAASRTMYIDQWGTDTYLVRVSNTGVEEAYDVATVCSFVGRVSSDTSLVLARRARPSNGAEARCDDGSASVSQPHTELPFTLDVATATGQLVDSSGVVWRKQDAPQADARDVAVLESFLGARVAGEGAERYVGGGSLGDDRVPLLYATTSGEAYERFQIGERVYDPDGTANYNVRLYATDGTVVQQRFMVRSAVTYGGPTLEDGQAVLLPFSILDGDVSFGVNSSWEVKSFGDAHVAFVHQFGSSSIVIAAEPLAVGGSCGAFPAPANAEALARLISADSAHEVTEPVPVRIAGIDGLQIDVTASSPQNDQYLCTFEETGTLTAFQSGGTRLRLFMVDHPGPSAGVITFAVMTTQDEFEDAIAELAPIIDSVEFHLD